MIIICALSRDHVIGNTAGDGMPWNVSEEYRQFLDFITDQTVIMGRKSYEIFKVDMPCAHIFVVSRTARELEGATVCRSLEEAVEKAKTTGKEIYIAGGGEIYAQAIPIVKKMYLSYIKGDFQGNSHFPNFDETEWRVKTQEDHPRFEFVVYERK